MEKVNAPIGVFDSGVGGISTLQTLAKALPNEDFIFYGDSENAPYGEKTADVVCDLASQVIDTLQLQAVKAVVIACNTATSAAKPQLVAAYPTLPIIGIEPALKQAVDAGKQHILVMATPLTISLPKYQAQVAKYQGTVEIQSLPCAGLADLVELGHAGLPQIENRLTELLSQVDLSAVDGLVLGCTHYPFIESQIKAYFDHPVAVYTGYDGIAHNLSHQLANQHLLRSANPERTVKFMSSRNTPTELALYQTLFDHGI
ncbi:glutamate racemase [Lactiplantibacillus fabifermentans]|uniref:Glutamate racemase n=2 Tax=Lactiplantibacillus fabifermentans TaxID=483011 RepID=A0A0R2NP00_9LACO|nr:glutamate racemase [Lactiplantibacillus fabifermentans]ETY74292.1 glutamate racemase [Lactiplantibacillus fabifermentans T30PCM01]KRO27412.1 glutamate racemase [Lactiplantibacillus fabifermentans DSM 21115]